MSKTYLVSTYRAGYPLGRPEVRHRPYFTRPDTHSHSYWIETAATPLEFVLGDEALVETPQGKICQWGEVRTDKEVVQGVNEIKVLKGVWECDPSEIEKYVQKLISIINNAGWRIKELEEKVSRRNQQIEYLRNQLTPVKQR